MNDRVDAALIAAAERLADDLLAPAAAAVDESGVLPRAHLDALASAGLYAVAGGELAHRTVEILAAACLTTTFVWVQHHGSVRAVQAAESPVRDEWLEPLRTGQIRAAVAQAAVRPGPPSVRATPVPGGFVFDGEAPWVTGWGLVNVVHTAARDPGDTVIWALLDADAGPTLAVEPLRLAAVNASRTVLVRFTGHFVPAGRVTGTFPFSEWTQRDAAGLRTNGSLALGAVAGCLRRLAANLHAPLSADLAAELDARRAQLDTAGPADLPAARAAAAELAMRAASTLVVASGAGGILAGAAAERLLREAAFLLVFGSRPAIRADLLRLVSRTGRTS
jgi:alkylation response protein AidB-like acyl-CoA dehydrogenase